MDANSNRQLQMAELPKGHNNQASISVPPSSLPVAERPKRSILYTVEENPPWHLCIVLAAQQFMTMVTSTITTPYIIGPALCIPDNSPGTAYVLTTIIFTSAITTLLQTTFGVRLPIVQGSSASFYAPIFAIMSLPEWQCPPTSGNLSYSAANHTTQLNADEIWHSRIREIQGAIAVASLLPVILSITGIITILLRYITPMVVVPTITLIGLSLLENAALMASQNWAISISTIILLALCSQFLENVQMPYPAFHRGHGFKIGWISWFKYFPIITVLVIMWLTCYILTACNVLQPGDGARTDVRGGILQQVPWIRVPYPGQWGCPKVSVASVIGMLSAVIATTIESIGDYYSCARLSEAPPPPAHAVSRGIMVEGLGCICAAMWGTGTGTTSYSDNIGAISITKVASRRVVQCSTAFMFLCSIFTYLGATLVTIPQPIIGGMMTFMFSLITAIGLSNVQYVNLNSSRNIFVLGFPLFFGLSFPKWMSAHKGALQTGNSTVDQVLTVLLSTGMLVGGVLGFILDNTLPGSDEDRGLVKWNQQAGAETGTDNRTTTLYDFPKWASPMCCQRLFSYLPVCPTFQASAWLRWKKPVLSSRAQNVNASASEPNGELRSQQE